MLRLLVVSVSGVPISSLLPKPVPNWFTCVIFRARFQMNQSKSSFVVMASSILWILRPTLIFPMCSTVLVWPRTCRLQSASPVMMFVCGIKASLTSSRCAAGLVIVFKTILLVVSDVVAVSLGIWLASVPPFNRLLLPPPLIPFLLFLHATDSVSVSGADPSNIKYRNYSYKLNRERGRANKTDTLFMIWTDFFIIIVKFKFFCCPKAEKS